MAASKFTVCGTAKVSNMVDSIVSFCGTTVMRCGKQFLVLTEDGFREVTNEPLCERELKEGAHALRVTEVVVFDCRTGIARAIDTTRPFAGVLAGGKLKTVVTAQSSVRVSRAIGVNVCGVPFAQISPSGMAVAIDARAPTADAPAFVIVDSPYGFQEEAPVLPALAPVPDAEVRASRKRPADPDAEMPTAKRPAIGVIITL